MKDTPRWYQQRREPELWPDDSNPFASLGIWDGGNGKSVHVSQVPTEQIASVNRTCAADSQQATDAEGF